MIQQAEPVQSDLWKILIIPQPSKIRHNVKAPSLFMLISEPSLNSSGSNPESLQQWQCQSISL